MHSWYIDIEIVNDYTITGQIKLYCGDKKTDRNTIQSMFGVGAAIGILLNNFISDVQGRKFSLIIALLMQILSVYCNLKLTQSLSLERT